MTNAVQYNARAEFFEIRISAVMTDVPLAYDIYLIVNEFPVLFRKQGDVIALKRLQQLSKHGAQEFLIPNDQKELFLGSLKSVMKNPDLNTDTKSRILKETAFLHVHDLFTSKNVSHVVEESKSLIEEMVNFISDDIGTVSSLMRLSVHDYYTYNHCVDVAVYAIALTRRILGNDKKTLLVAGMGGFLHDVGKRKIDWSIINKKDPLNAEEWKEIKNHPNYGKEYVDPIESIPADSKKAVHEHHENFDGTGYPQGLEDDQINIVSRIVSIADVFDALTTNRSYHNSVQPHEALKIMYSMQPGKFDPNIFKAFNKNFEKKGPIELPENFDPCQAVPTVDSTWNKKGKKTGS